jgi:hypothetical protein
MRKQEKQENFLSLTAAAVLVYNEATGNITDDPGLLQEVARCIASHAQLHGKSQYSQEFRPIPQAGLHISTFEDAAHRLLAPNGACDYRDLSIALADFHTILPTVAALCRANTLLVVDDKPAAAAGP